MLNKQAITKKALEVCFIIVSNNNNKKDLARGTNKIPTFKDHDSPFKIILCHVHSLPVQRVVLFANWFGSRA